MVGNLRRRSRALYTALVSHRFVVRLAFDVFAWWIALVLATTLRLEFKLNQFHLSRVILAFALISALQLVMGAIEGLYVGRFSYGSFEEAAALVRTVVVTATIATLAVALTRPIPASVPVSAAFIALSLMAGTRYAWRLSLERKQRPSQHAARLLVVGAGEGATQVVTAMLRNPNSNYIPAVIVDDDPRKRNLRIRNVPVEGTRNDIRMLARKYNASTMLIAIPSAPAELVRELSAIGARADLDVKVVPPVDELFDGRVGVGDIRPVTPEDLLGRREIRTDLASIAGYLAGRRVLVTGAGGSIGSELCRQVEQFSPAELLMLDRDESALHSVQLSMEGKALLMDSNLIVADIRDVNRMEYLFEVHRPQVVLHAAALKHLPLLERHPDEAVKTNIFGTHHLLRLSVEYGVERFVNISTDKAADPTSVLGYTKRITERITSYADGEAGGTGDYLSVRFGNVLGSRGSVLTTFFHQIEAGGPLTVTDPEVTRYFMTVEEAVQLVIQAGALGSGGDVLVLEMGKPVKIADVARRLAEQSDRPIEVVFTGLRPGEKLHEVLLGEDEVVAPTDHPLIYRTNSVPLDPEELRDFETIEPMKVMVALAE